MTVASQAVGEIPWHLRSSYLTYGWHSNTGTDQGALLPSLRNRADRGVTDAARSKQQRQQTVTLALGPNSHGANIEAYRRFEPAPACDWRRLPILESLAATSTKPATSKKSCASRIVAPSLCSLEPAGAAEALNELDPQLKTPRMWHDDDEGIADPFDMDEIARGEEVLADFDAFWCLEHEVVERSFFEGAFRDGELLLKLVKASPSVKRLRLAGHDWFDAHILEQLGSAVSQLEELILRRTRATDAVVAAFVASSSSLRRLDVSECDITNLKCLSSLQSLCEFRACHCAQAVTPSLVTMLSKNKLEALDISFCPLVNTECLIEFAKGCYTLRHLELDGCTQVGSDGVVAICNANPMLEHLSLSLLEKLHDEPVAQTVSVLKRLRTLDLSGCHALGRMVGRAISWNCEFIEKLCLARLDLGDAQIYAIVSNCPHLRLLDLSNYRGSLDDSILFAMSQAKCLRHVVLTHTPQISPELVAQIRKQCPDIRVDREARRFVEPNDITACLGEPWKPTAKEKSTNETKKVAKSKAGGKKKK